MPFQIIRNDITKVKADAIVNTANPMPGIGQGTDSAVYSAAGEADLLNARKAIGIIEPGSAEYTDAFKLNARYIIHTVGPTWSDGNHGERDILRSCYEKSLYLAEELGCKSIAFPLIASGINGFPKDEALSIALAEIGKYLLSHEMKVSLVVFDRKAVELSRTLLGEISHYIGGRAVRRIRKREYSEDPRYPNRRIRNTVLWENEELAAIDARENPPALNLERPSDNPGGRAELYEELSRKRLDEVLENTGSSFRTRLFELIDAKGMTDVAVYKRANIDRKVFSSIRCKKNYRPKKKTAVALAIALELDMNEMIDLLSRAEIAFSPSSKFDLIIMYFVEHRIYDIFENNAALFHYGQPILG